MKRVLVITEAFPPAFNPRMGYLVKHIPEFGWDADVITVKTLEHNNYNSLVGKNKIERVSISSTEPPMHGAFSKIWFFLNLKNNFFNNSRAFVEKIDQVFDKTKYSLILVSVAWRNTFVLDAGSVISEKWDIPLVVDVRDLIEQKPVSVNRLRLNVKDVVINNLVRNFEKKKMQMRNRVFESASALITVSPFHVDQLSKYNNNVLLIYNGFDSDLYYDIKAEKTNFFSIVYTGLVFDKKEQDPTFLFEAVVQLEKNNVIKKNNFRIQFYTPSNYRNNILNHELYKDVEKYIDFFDYVEFTEIPNILRKASIALVLTNISDNSKGPRGILTTKFFDYLGAERPVLCVRSDEDVLEDSINRANVGMSARSTRETYEFILEKWDEWKMKGNTSVNVNQEYKQQFTRRYQVKQFTDVFDRVLRTATSGG